MATPATEHARRAEGEIPDGAVEGALTFSDAHEWFGSTRPQHIGIAGLKHYLSHGKPETFVLKGAFLFAELEGQVFSKTEIDRMARRLADRTEDVQPDVHDEINAIRDKNGYQKRALGFALQPQRPDSVDGDEELPEWITGALFYEQPTDRMVGPELKKMPLHEFGRTFTDDGHIFVFEPGPKMIPQLFAGIEIARSDQS